MKTPLHAGMILIGCIVTASSQSTPTLSPNQIHSIAIEQRAIWNGVAVSPQGRIFVNFPALSPRPIQAVGEIGKDGKSQPYPGGSWNNWAPGQPVENAFVGTNAIRIGPEGDLWVVDTGSPSFGSETLPSAPKIVRIDLKDNAVKRVYPLGPTIALRKSYIDDIRFNGNLAYLTDAGVPGIIVVNLASGAARRVLDHDKTTTGLRPIVVDGETVNGPDGKPLILNTDQMEVTPDGKWLYFQALSGPLYRVATRWLDDPSVEAEQLANHVGLWFDTHSLGGTAIDAAGNLYLEDLGDDSIKKLTPDRKISTIARDKHLHWVDAPCIHDGWLYLPQAQIDRAPQFHGGKSKIEWPLHLYKLKLPER